MINFSGSRLTESANMLRTIFEDQDILQTFLSDSDRDAEELFLDENVSMIVSSYFSLNEIKEHEIPYDIAPLPFMKDSRTLLLIIGFAINKHSTKLEAAKRFVDYTTNSTAQEMIRKETLSIPSVKTIAERSGNEIVYKSSRFQLFKEIIPTYCLYTDIGLNSQQLNEVQNELRVYLSNLMDEKILYERIHTKLNNVNTKREESM